MIRATSLNPAYQTNFSNCTIDAIADIPVEKGGAGQGFGPHELLEAALATCLTMTVQMYASKHGLPLTSAGCEVRMDRSVPDVVTLAYLLVLEGPLSEEQSARLHEAARRCPVAGTLTGTIKLRPVTAEEGIR